MPDRSDFQYTIIRVVPRVERGECINVGVVLFSRQLRFIGSRIKLDHRRLRALSPGADPAAIEPHLDAIQAVVDGDPAGGPVARLAPSERFGWVAAISSTVIQPSEVHTGLTDDPDASLRHLFDALVTVTPNSPRNSS
jgi:hypothetical protein